MKPDHWSGSADPEAYPPHPEAPSSSNIQAESEHGALAAPKVLDVSSQFKDSCPSSCYVKEEPGHRIAHSSRPWWTHHLFSLEKDPPSVKSNTPQEPRGKRQQGAVSPQSAPPHGLSSTHPFVLWELRIVLSAQAKNNPERENLLRKSINCKKNQGDFSSEFTKSPTSPICHMFLGRRDLLFAPET